METESHPVASSVACSLYRVTVVAEGVAASLQCCVVVRAAILLQDRYVLMLLFLIFNFLHNEIFFKCHKVT